MFSTSFQLFSPLRTCWALTRHVPPGSPFPRFRPRFRPLYTCFQLFSLFRTCSPLTGHVPSDFRRTSPFSLFRPRFRSPYPRFQLFSPFRKCFPFTGHVKWDSRRVNRFRISVHVFGHRTHVFSCFHRSFGLPTGLPFSCFRPRFWPPYPLSQVFSPFRTCFPLTGHVTSDFHRFRVAVQVSATMYPRFGRL